VIKTDIVLDQRYGVSGYGRGRVIDLMPEHKFYVKVKYDLDAKFPGQEMNAEVARMKPLAPPKPTRAEKVANKVSAIRSTPHSYYIAGLAAATNGVLHGSTPPSQLDATQDELFGHGCSDFKVGEDEGVTVSTDLTQGRSYSLVMVNHGKRDEYAGVTGVISTLYQGNEAVVSIQAKEFILDFLLDDLRFKLLGVLDRKNGKVQDLVTIRGRVPAAFLPDFDRGVADGTARKQAAA
jgi:hypothetical protein